MNSAHNEGKSVTSKKLIRTLKNEISKHMTLISKMFILINYIIHLTNRTVHIISQLK